MYTHGDTHTHTDTYKKGYPIVKPLQITNVSHFS